MADEELSQEDVFNNDIDPLDGIRALRKEQGVAEEDLPINDEPSAEALPDEIEPGADELDELRPEPEPESEPEPEAAQMPAAESAPAEGEEEPAGEEASDDTEEDSEVEEPTTAETLKFRANGQDFEFTSQEISEQFETVFGQAMDYTQKMQKIAPYRKMISALESDGVTQDQLNLALDALQGDKAAIQKILETNKIDNYDLTPDDDSPEYAPTNRGKDDFQLQIEEVTSKIEQDPEYKITVDVIDKQWDQNSRATIASNPTMIQGLHNDIKTGLYDKVSPMAMKMKVLDGNTKSDVEYYMLAGEKLRLEQQGTAQTVDELNAPAQAADSKFEEASSEAQRKRAATSTRARADRKGVIDYLDDDDEAYDAWYKKTMASH